MRDAETFLVSAEGAENTKRPLVFKGSWYIFMAYKSNKGNGNDVGKSVTDITIYTFIEGNANEQKKSIFMGLSA